MNGGENPPSRAPDWTPLLHGSGIELRFIDNKSGCMMYLGFEKLDSPECRVQFCSYLSILETPDVVKYRDGFNHRSPRRINLSVENKSGDSR